MEFEADSTGSIESVKFTNQSRVEQTFTATSSARGGATYGDFATDWGTPISYTANTPEVT